MSQKKLSELLADPAIFAGTLIKAGGGAVSLDPWQKDFLRNQSKFVCVLKSRRVGGSWIMAVKMFIRSQTVPGYRGFFVSLNREEARGKIEYVDEMHDSLPRSMRLKRVARSKDEIAFVNHLGKKSLLRSLAGKAPRGRGGDVGVSELPHCLNSRQIYEGALHVTARNMKHSLTVESTPLGKGGIFHDISRGSLGNFSRYEIPWWLCSALCVNVPKASISAYSMSTKDRVRIFGSKSLKAIHASMPERAFAQESELEFVEMEDAAFPMELIMTCAEAEFSPFAGSPLLFRKVESVPSPSDWEWLSRARLGALFIGFDVGRKKDQSAMAVLDLVGGKFETRMTVSMRQTPFSSQREAVEAAIRCGASAFVMDSTGAGMDMAERMERAFPEVAKGLSFTPKSKMKMVEGMFAALSERRLVIPAERDVLAHLASVREVISGSGNKIYNSTRAGGHHADMAWALMLALEAARGVNHNPAPVEYSSISRRRSMRDF